MFNDSKDSPCGKACSVKICRLLLWKIHGRYIMSCFASAYILCWLQVFYQYKHKYYCLEEEDKITYSFWHNVVLQPLSSTIYLRGLGANTEWAPCPGACVCLCIQLHLKLLLFLLLLSLCAQPLPCCVRVDEENVASCFFLPPCCPLGQLYLCSPSLQHQHWPAEHGVRGAWQEAPAIRLAKREGTGMSCSEETAWTCNWAAVTAVRPTGLPSCA